MTKREAWVRGVGAITPLGPTWPESRDRLAAGQSGVRAVHEGFDTAGYPSRAAAAVEWPTPPGLDRRAALAARAADEALACGALEGVPAERVGIFVGAESGRGTFANVTSLARAAGGGARFDHERFGRAAPALTGALDAVALSPAAVASMLARRTGARGPAVTLSLACSSASAAIGEAVRALRLGACDAALAGGVGADVDPFMLAGFGLLGALSASGVSCPFDVRRDGFVVGEGAAFVVLATDRGDARVRVAGVGRSLDAHHLTAPDPDGAGAELAMRRALADAGVDHVDYVQAHGTSTPLNDAIEARALARVLGDRAAVGAVKGALGHWIAGAGAIGLLCAVEAVTSGLFLPTAGLREPDPACELPHVTGQARRARAERALVNSFAFGGANTTLVVAA
jgi:3-oxoacyl-[acyl-carrier-protein] synthase II